MAKFLVLRTTANVKVAEIEVSEKPEEKDVIAVGAERYRIFRCVTPNLKRGNDIVFRCIVTPV